MKVYYDVFSDDEIISDSFKFEQVFDGVGAEVKARWVVKGVGNIDIGCSNEFGGKSEDDEGVDDKAEKCIDVVDTFRYTETSYTKEDYTSYIKAYMKKVKAHLEEKNKDRVAPFMKGAQEMVKWVLGNFKEFQFFMGEKCDPETHLALAYYKNPDDEAPTFVYFMDGLKAKVF